MRSIDSTADLWLRGFLMATVIGGLALCSCNPAAYAAEADVVGVLALALEEDVSKSLGISPQVREQLLDLVDHREMDVLDIALRIRSLPAAEQAAQLAPYRAKSEQMGLLLLTAKQRQSLLAISAKRAGLESLAKSGVAARLKLSAEQKADVKRLISERDAAMQNVDRKELKRLQKSYERQFRATLSDEQFTTWQQLTELGPLDEKKPGPGNDNNTVANAGNRPIQNDGPVLGDPVQGNEVPNGDGRLMFNFRYAPWRGVLDWFSTQADLSLVMDAPPQGTFNYTDAREYTPAEAIDLLNSVLQTKGYTLLRRQRMLMLINLEDGIPPNLIDEVSVDELDTRGEYELVRCLFSLERTSPEVAEQEIAKLIGPQGEVVALQAARKLLVRETAGRLRTVRKVLDAMEGKEEEEDLGKATLLSLRYLKAADVMVPLRQLMGLAEDQNSAPDGSLRIAIGPGRRQMMVTGRPHRVKELDAVVKLLDVPPGGVNGPLDIPQLEVYSVTDADPTSVLEVMQTLLAGLDDVRLASDPKTGNLVALARPAQHETISATLAQMQRDRRQIEVIRLHLIDPQLAMMSIEKLFGAAGGEERADANAPRVDADLTTQSLLIRGSKSQVADIRDLLEKLGENGTTDETSLVGGSGNLRMLPITGSVARRVLEQVGEIWPSVRKNRIRTVTPSSSIRAIQPGRRRVLPNKDKEEPSDSSKPGKEQPSAAELPRTPARPLNNTVAWSTDTAAAVADLVNKQNKNEAAGPAMADIVVTPGQRGILIASDDLEALDEFEQLVRTLADRLFTGSQEVAIFYLKYVKAEVASDLLKQFLGGGGGDSDGGGGSLLSNLAGAALGGDSGGGGLIGSLLGLGGGGGGGSIMSMGSSLTITADTRLNALLLQASPDDLDFAEQILEVIDASAGPEAVQTIPPPQIIPVLNADADEIAAMVRTVYATRLSGQSAQPRQPSPEDLIRAMSGQRNKRRSMKDSIQDQVSVSINVDPRQNSLIVVAPQSVFKEIEALVTQLDVAIPGLRKTIRTVSISRSNPETIQRALAAILGDAVQTTGSAGGSAKGTSSASGTSPGSGGPTPQQSADQFRRRMEFLKALQKSSQKAAKGKGGDSSPKK